VNSYTLTFRDGRYEIVRAKRYQWLADKNVVIFYDNDEEPIAMHNQTLVRSVVKARG